MWLSLYSVETSWGGMASLRSSNVLRWRGGGDGGGEGARDKPKRDIDALFEAKKAQFSMRPPPVYLGHIDPRKRREKVRGAMIKAWSAYRTYAWGYDELRPLTLGGQNNWGGVGATIIDALDTLWIMGLKDEFKEGRDWVRDHLSFENSDDHMSSVFETTIRILGGLLSAYDLSGDEVFLNKARDLGDRLMPAFETPTGLPYGFINLKTGSVDDGDHPQGYSILSEMGSLQLEFRALSERTGDDKYGVAALRIFDFLETLHPPDGLYPLRIHKDDGTFDEDRISFGAMGDSFCESKYPYPVHSCRWMVLLVIESFIV